MTDNYWRGGGGGAGVGDWGGRQGGDVTAWGGGGPGAWGQHRSTEPRLQQIIKATTAVFLGGSLLVLSGLTVAATVIALTIATPLLVLFSPVLVPAVITVFMLVTGFLASGGFGIAGVSVLAWIYRFATGQHPVGADQLEQARMKLAGKARDVRDTARDQFGSTGGGHHYGATTTTTSTT